MMQHKFNIIYRDYQVIKAINSTAGKFITGLLSLAELGANVAKLLYKGAWHATKVDLLTNPEYEGALSDEAKNRLGQEIQQDYDKLNSVLSKETGKAILHGLKNHYAAEVQRINEKAAAGDICGMAKQATEFAIDTALMASAAGSGAMVTAKLSKKAGKIAGATAKEVVNVAGDAAVNAVCATAKTITPDSTLTFKFDMEAQKAQRAAAIANKEITSTGRPIISKDSSRGCARNNYGISSKLKSSLFTPAFDEISYFSAKSYLDRALYPTEKLPTLVKYLEKRGVHVYEAIKDPCFIARKEWVNHIYLTKNPTVLEVKHELSHWLDYKRLGYEKYSKLSRFDREQLVLERLQKNKVWDDLNNFEKEFAIRYVEKLKPKITAPAPGVKND